MSTTTASAIRTAMVDLVESIAPSLHSGDAFHSHRGPMDFRKWALKNPRGCHRRFSVRFGKRVAPPAVSDLVAEEADDTVEVVVAYSTGRFGADGEDLDAAIESDQTQIHAAIGPPGYRSLTAPACVTLESDWAVEGDDEDPIRFAVIEYRVRWYRATGATSDAVQFIGPGGIVYKTGDVIERLDIGDTAFHALYLINGLVKLTYKESAVVGSECLAHHLYLADGSGGWSQTVNGQYGDWSVFAVYPTPKYDRVTVVEASDDAVELAWQLDALDLDTYPYDSLGGIPYRDVVGALNYAQGASNPNWKLLTQATIVKSIRMQRGEAGYYLGWHSSPLVGPHDSKIPEYNNNTSWGEREFGTGSGSNVVWASTGHISRHPAWGAKQEFVDAGFAPSANRTAWVGIDDATYAPWDTALAIATQNPGFPAEQTSGVIYVADIAEGYDVVRYICLRERLEVGVWQYSTTDTGSVVIHFVNEFHSPAGVPFRHQLFFGVTPYVADASSAYANEPKADIVAQVATLAASVDWPAT